MKRAVITGAGPAGLTAAYWFLKHTDIKPIVLEKENFVGGISRTANFDGDRIDIGGHRFFSKSAEIFDLWRELLPLQGAPALDDKMLGRRAENFAGGADPEREDDVFLLRRRISRILYMRRFFSYPVSLSAQTVFNLGVFNSFSIGASFLKAAVFKRTEKNLEDFMINRFGEKLYATFFRDYTEKVWGRSPKDIDADWGSQRIKGLSLSGAVADFFRKAAGKTAKETSLIERFYYPKYGPGQLWEKMAREIVARGGEIVFGAEAKRFNLDGKTVVSVTAETNAGARNFAGDYFLSSMPIADLAAALPKGAIGEKARAVALSLPYRDFVTVGLLVDRLKLVNSTKIKTLGGIVPDCWIYIQEPKVKIGRLQIFNNWSPYMLNDPKNTVWLGLEYFCREGDELWRMTKDDFAAFAANELAEIGVIDAAAVKKSVCLKVKKAYPAYFDSYRDFATVRRALDEMENLFCIGRNGQHRYNNMDHSMLTAITAVRAITGEKNRADVWNVNADEVYHEESAKRGR